MLNLGEIGREGAGGAGAGAEEVLRLDERLPRSPTSHEQATAARRAWPPALHGELLGRPQGRRCWGCSRGELGTPTSALQAQPWPSLCHRSWLPRSPRGVPAGRPAPPAWVCAPGAAHPASSTNNPLAKRKVLTCHPPPGPANF